MKKEKTFFIVENINSGQKNSLNWVEESSPLDLFGEKSGNFLGLSLSVKKLRFFMGLVFLVLLILVAKSFYLQVVKGNYYFSLAENNRLRTKYVKAQRGIIYDRNNKVLVQNVFGFSLLLTPVDLPKKSVEREQVLAEVARITGLNVQDVEDKIKNANQYYFQPIVIKTGIDYSQAMALKIASADLPGVTLDIDSWRKYIYGNETSHLLGYVGKINADEYDKYQNQYLLSDNIGKTGLEQYYEDILRGEHGKTQVEIDALGREKKITAQELPVTGSDLILTIDLDLQTKIFQILEKRLNGKKAAVVIVSNPQNGEILAMADYPSYDNNLFSTGISQVEYGDLLSNDLKPLFTRSIMGEYPSGSTIKPVIAAGALQEGIITANTTFNSVGGLWVGDQWFFPDWLAGGHGLTNIFKAIAWSVNTYFYYIGGGYADFKGLSVEGLDKYFRLFGLGDKLGVDLPGEQSGLVPDKEWKQKTKNEIWYIGDTYHLSIGQGDLLVTPLQVNSYNSTIANGGILYRPHLVRGVVGPDDQRELIISQVIRSDIVSSNNLSLVRQGMRMTVTGGSAQSLNDLPVKVAGKTGTAQWNNQKMNHAWFNGFAPYDKPTFSITVLVEEGGEGSSISVPIAKDIMLYWFSRNN